MKKLFLPLLAVVIISTGCSGAAGGNSGVDAEGSDALPSASATDWVTYSDHLVQVHVDSEARVAATKEEQEAGEGVIGRQVTMTVESVHWTRPGVRDSPPMSMTWDAGGWVFHGKNEETLQYDGVPSLLPGHRYLVPIVHMAQSFDGKGTPVWLPLSGAAMLPFDDLVVGRGERIADGRGYYDGDSGGETPMRDSIWGKKLNVVVSLLNGTAADPAAAPYMSEVPRVRYVETLNSKNDSSPPAPGPGEIP